MFPRVPLLAPSLKLLAFLGLGLGFARAFDFAGSPGGRPRSGRALLPLLALPLAFAQRRTYPPLDGSDEVIYSQEDEYDDDPDGEEHEDVPYYEGDGAGDYYDPDDYDEENRPCDWDYPSTPEDEEPFDWGYPEDPPYDDEPIYSEESPKSEDNETLPIVIIDRDGRVHVLKGPWDGDLDHCILIDNSQDHFDDETPGDGFAGEP